MAIVVHMQPSVTRNRPYGATEAAIFLKEVLSSAAHVPIQIAHLAGAGGFDDPFIDKALSVFIRAIARRDKRMANVYFDICGVTGMGQWKEKKALIAERIRQVGVQRILWGSDGAFGGGMTPSYFISVSSDLAYPVLANLTRRCGEIPKKYICGTKWLSRFRAILKLRHR